jgi:hypothetical protein
VVPGYGPCMPLPYIGPNKKRGRWYEATTRFASSRPGQFLARHVNPRIDPWLYRATGGRYPSCLGTIATAPLTATGAKSGQPREVELTYFHDGSDPILIASNYGGTQTSAVVLQPEGAPRVRIRRRAIYGDPGH